MNLPCAASHHPRDPPRQGMALGGRAQAHILGLRSSSTTAGWGTQQGPQMSQPNPKKEPRCPK